jgi:hypothetical protein
MAQPRRPAKPLAIQILVIALGLLLLVGLYLLAMRLTVDLSMKTDTPAQLDRRDEIYGLIHLGILLLGLVSGFGAGKWLNGLGVAYAGLFAVVLVTAMVATQLGSEELACHGHNDLVRHWRCGPLSDSPPQVPTATPGG